MTRPERRGQRSDHAKHGRNRGDSNFARKPVLERIDFLPHAANIADDAAGPVERAFSFRGKPDKPRAALDQHHAKDFLKLFEARRHGRLRDAAEACGVTQPTMSTSLTPLEEILGLMLV